MAEAPLTGAVTCSADRGANCRRSGPGRHPNRVDAPAARAADNDRYHRPTGASHTRGWVSLGWLVVVGGEEPASGRPRSRLPDRWVSVSLLSLLSLWVPPSQQRGRLGPAGWGALGKSRATLRPLGKETPNWVSK